MPFPFCFRRFCNSYYGEDELAQLVRAPDQIWMSSVRVRYLTLQRKWIDAGGNPAVRHEGVPPSNNLIKDGTHRATVFVGPTLKSFSFYFRQIGSGLYGTQKKRRVIMSIDELKFRWHYFWNTLKTWISNGAILCKDPLYWDLWADNERVEWHVGSFWQFIKWIVTHETFDNL